MSPNKNIDTGMVHVSLLKAFEPAQRELGHGGPSSMATSSMALDALSQASSCASVLFRASSGSVGARWPGTPISDVLASLLRGAHGLNAIRGQR